MYGSVKGVCNVCVCRVSCTQALSTVLFRCRLVAVVVLAPVWTVSWPETLTVSGTELQPSVSPCLQLTQTGMVLHKPIVQRSDVLLVNSVPEHLPVSVSVN